MKISIDPFTFEYIEVNKTVYHLGKNNSGPVSCRDCKKTIGADLGIYRQSYKRNGYICFSCFSKDIVSINISGDRDAGFFIDTIGRLRACFLSSPSYSTAEIVALVYSAMLETAENKIELILGLEGAHPFAIMDAAEASL